MPKKIKVVEISAEEEPIQEVKSDLGIPSSEPIEEELKSEPVLEPTEPEPVLIEEKEPEPKTKQIEQPPIVENQELEKTPEEKPKKQPAVMGTCEVCGKTMLMKTLRYSHPKLCQSSKPQQEPKAKKPKNEEPATPKPQINPVVSFENHRQVEEVKPIDLYSQHRQARLQQRQVRVKNLISQAV